MSKAKQLRKHKAIATGLFILMAIIYISMVYLHKTNPMAWIGYVKAFSEAAMVGALADWFAVTALFRYPLGLKIPHTNLIENHKNDFGENLGYFVKENFLTPANIRPYIERLDAASLASQWINKETNREILETEILNLIRKIIYDLDDEEVARFLTNKGSELLQSIDYQHAASRGIQYIIKSEEHIKLLETILPQLKDYITENQELIRNRIQEQRPFIAFLAGKKISKEITDGFALFIEEIEQDENHFVRQKLTENLEKFAYDIQVSTEWKEKFSQLKNELITPENLSQYAEDAWTGVKENIQENLDKKGSALKTQIRKNIDKLAFNLGNDEVLQNRLNGWIRFFLYRMILKNSQQVEVLIRDTVSGWEGRELSDKLELEVGKDLQFIRINGTLVGGLVGLLIYVFTKFVLE